MYSIFYSQFQQRLWTNNNLPPEIANIRHLCGWVPAAVYANYCCPILKKVAITELVTAHIGRLWIELRLCCTLRILFSKTWDLLDILWTWSSMQHPFSAFHAVKAGTHTDNFPRDGNGQESFLYLVSSRSELMALTKRKLSCPEERFPNWKPALRRSLS